MDAMSSGYESDAEPMSTDMLEYFLDEIQFHPSVNRRESHYNIRDNIKRGQAEWKQDLLSTRSMGKGLHKVFKAVFNDI